MFSVSRTDHTLEKRDLPDGIWVPARAGMYAPANLLTADGRINEALSRAYELQIEHYGHTRDMEFRVVTLTRTTSTQFNPVPSAPQ